MASSIINFNRQWVKFLKHDVLLLMRDLNAKNDEKETTMGEEELFVGDRHNNGEWLCKLC
jgi:hypothetical protein